MISLDHESGAASIVKADREIVTTRIVVPAEQGSVTRTTFIPAESRLEVVAVDETFSMRLGGPQDAPSAPVVYLDQNHWIDFAKWRKRPTDLTPSKRPFFELLDQAANEDRAIVPISSAHLSETSNRGARESRLDLATTMLHYSRGWQLRTVLALRRGELRALFGGAPVTKTDAITLAPDAILDKDPNHSLDTQGLGPEITALVQQQVWACVLVNLLLDHEPANGAGREAAEEWAQSFAPLAENLRINSKARALSRDATRIRFISDLGRDLPAAAKESGLDSDQFSEWLQNQAENAILATPGLGRMREVLHFRLSNADDIWEGNDLNDWLHLTYAAGYCDIVLGEKKTINYLLRAEKSVPQGAILHRRSADAYEDLKTLLGPS